MKTTGTISKILSTQEGVGKDGKKWKKLQFLLETSQQYNNLYCINIMGEDKVNDFLNTYVESELVEVHINIKTNLWKDKYFTNLDLWKIDQISSNETPIEPTIDGEDLPTPEDYENQEVSNQQDDLPF